MEPKEGEQASSNAESTPRLSLFQDLPDQPGHYIVTDEFLRLAQKGMLSSRSYAPDTVLRRIMDVFVGQGKVDMDPLIREEHKEDDRRFAEMRAKVKRTGRLPEGFSTQTEEELSLWMEMRE